MSEFRASGEAVVLPVKDPNFNPYVPGEKPAPSVPKTNPMTKQKKELRIKQLNDILASDPKGADEKGKLMDELLELVQKQKQLLLTD